MNWNIVGAEEAELAVLRLREKVVKRIRVSEGMYVVEMGCGQGGFTSMLSKEMGDRGRLLAVDISIEYYDEFVKNLGRWGAKEKVTFVKADAANLKDVINEGVADMVVSYRFLEELKHPEDMRKIVKEMVRIVKKGGKVCVVELSTEARNVAEENYIRLHRESGDSLFDRHEITEAFKSAGLSGVKIEKLESAIWLSPNVAKQDLSLAQVWFDEEVKSRLESSIDKYGMKFPALLAFLGVKLDTIR